MRGGFANPACSPGTGWPRISRILRKQSLQCWRPSVPVESGPPAHLISERPASSIVLHNWNRNSSFVSTATSTAANAICGTRKFANCWLHCRLWKKQSWCRTSREQTGKPPSTERQAGMRYSTLTRIRRQKSNLPRCRLHIPCGSCFRPERRGCRKQSCTVTVAYCSSK